MNDVFQRHISALEAELLETAQVTFGPPPNPPFFNSRALSSRLGAMANSRDSSRNSRTKLPGAAPMEADEATSSTPQGSIISSVVVAEKKKPERPAETSRSKYVEKVKELDLEDLECRLELAKALGLEQVSHENLGRLQCVDWLKAHETHFSRAKMQRELDMQKGARPKERVVTGSRPESRMEVDEAPRSKGRFNLDRAAQEHMNEGLEMWIPSESASSLRGLETQVIRPLMDVALPGYTPSSTPL